MVMDAYVSRYLKEVESIAKSLDPSKIEEMIELLVKLREAKGRVFFLGVGGGAGNSTHAVNDFRKIGEIEAYTPTDNVSELTARTNDDGWGSVFTTWLKASRLNANDAVFVFSVGGGSEAKNISVNIVEALKYAREVGAKILGIVGRDGGYTAMVADACIIVPAMSSDTVTAHTESFQVVLEHLIISHPQMRVSEMKWESVRR